MMDEIKNFPTMIIPNGTDISVNEHGQLSIRTPGNLVIQNSGVYSVIESGNGSVRIDPEVKVEAVSVQAADSCFVAGQLTAWRVRARTIILERGAQANIMLQESESLELDRNARLVGNFASEKELYLMLGRFSRQLRDLPNGVFAAGDERRRIPAEAAAGAGAQPERPLVSPDGEREASASSRQEHSEVISLIRVILEREIAGTGAEGAAREPLGKMLDLVRAGDSERLRANYRYLFSQIEHPSEPLQRARDMLAKLLGTS
jgi:hypothetical protein